MKSPMITMTAIGLVAGSVFANAQTSATIPQLLADGFEIKTMTAARIDLDEASNGEEALFVLLQKDAEAFTCVLQSTTSSFCQRIE